MKKLIEELFRNYYKNIYSYLYNVSHDASLSEDLASDVFVEVMRSISSFREESDIRTWMFSIARHKWYEYLRNQNKYPQREYLDEFIPSRDKDCADSFAEKEILQRIYELTDSLSDKSRTIVRMRFDGYSFYETALAAGVSENSARVIYFRARTKIIDILKKEGYINE